MTKGRKPTPANQKVISGNFRKDRANEDAIEYEAVESLADFPDAPLTLNLDGSEMWNKLGPQLVASKVLQVVDLYVLEQLCYSWQRFRQKARAAIDLTAAEDNAMKSLFAEFGMTPASRCKVTSTGDKKPANKFATNGKRAQG